MNLKLYLQNKIEKVALDLYPDWKGQSISFDINYPPETKFGNYSSNVAMKLAPYLHRGPGELAEEIRKKISNMPPFIHVKIANPGFLNFYINEKWLVKQVGVIIKEKKLFGQSLFGKGKKVQIEFISANPTGPLHLGNGRGGFTGDVLANILKLAGYRVQREYYINDIGNQASILAESVLRRYWQHQGIRIEYPEYCYQGKYIDELAKELFLPNYKLNNVKKLEEVKEKIKSRILKKMVSNIKVLAKKKLGIKFDHWFYEHTLYSSGLVDRLLKQLKEKGLLYKDEGAIWLRTRQYGDDKDRVLIKANEEPVYFLSDIAYHWNKFTKRKFDKVIDIWGADHHGYIGRMQAAMKIFELDGKLDIIIVQLVRLMEKGQEVRMSKRTGTFVTLEELVDQVGIDASRFFFLSHDYNTHMNFDLDLAKKKSQDNPVFYVQYAHARICSIMKKAKQYKARPSDKRAILERAEIDLLNKLIKWPELVLEVSQSYQVSKLPAYATELATAFHDFYTRCKVINGTYYNERRMNIVKATRQVLQNVLSAMGISAPEKM